MRRYSYIVIAVLLLAGCGGPSAEQQAATKYHGEVVAATRDLGIAMKDFTQKIATPQFDDQSWRSGMLVDLESMRYAYQQLDAITPPKPLVLTHAKLEYGLKKCAEGADQLQPSVESGIVDLSSVEAFNSLFVECTQNLQLGLTELQVYLDTFE